MFTGIIEEIGKVRAIDRSDRGATFSISAKKTLEGTQIGDSINTNGVCLTVTKLNGASFTIDAIAETLRRSNLGKLGIGNPVNLERALPAGGRLGGHIVQGHVDVAAPLLQKRADGDSWILRFSLPGDIARYVVEKGSIAINGISLTVAGLGQDWFEVAIIPHTVKETNIGQLEPGSVVNLEADILAKHVERLLAGWQSTAQSSKSDGLTAAQVEALGY